MEGIEDEVGTWMAFGLNRDELNALYLQALQELREAVVDNRDGEGSPAEVKRLTGNIDREGQQTVELEDPTLTELPGVDLLSLCIEGPTQVPARMGAPVVHQFVIAGHVTDSYSA
jgi:hypothetical protein